MRRPITHLCRGLIFNQSFCQDGDTHLAKSGGDGNASSVPVCTRATVA